MFSVVWRVSPEVRWIWIWNLVLPLTLTESCGFSQDLLCKAVSHNSTSDRTAVRFGGGLSTAWMWSSISFITQQLYWLHPVDYWPVEQIYLKEVVSEREGLTLREKSTFLTLEIFGNFFFARPKVVWNYNPDFRAHLTRQRTKLRSCISSGRAL